MEAAVLWVVLAGFLEPVWVVSLKRYNSTKNPLWAAVVVFFLFFGPYCLSMAEAGGVSASIAYSVWVSIGTVMTTLAGVILFKDRMDRLRVVFILLIMVGIVGLQMTGAS